MDKRRNLLGYILFIMTILLSQDINGQNNYDWTGIIKNPSFESGTTGWTFTKNVSGWEDFKIVQGSAPNGNQHYNIWAAQVTSLDISQTISLPAGHYTLSAQFMTNPQGVNDQHVYARFASGTANSQQLNVSDQWTRLSVDFTLPSDGVVTIGATSTGTGNNEKGWFCIDDFRLTGNQNPGDDAAIDGKSAGPCIEYPSEILGIVIPLEYHIVYSRTNYRAGKRDEHQIIDQIGRELILLCLLNRKRKARQHRCRNDYSVPVHLKTAYLDSNGIYIQFDSQTGK